MELIGYVTIEEAGRFVSLSFLSTDEKRKKWEALSDEDKAVLLRQSFNDIESLSFRGRKTDPNQAASFPRNCQKEIPEDVKAAQIVGAVYKLNVGDAYDMESQGITSEKVGSVSYTYKQSQSTSNNKCRPEVFAYLKKYIKTVQVLNIR